jgi:uncharacterized protein (DUF305 family)
MPRGNLSVSHDLFRLAMAVLIGVLLPAASQAAEPAPDRSTARFEINFMHDMIDHHAMAVEMANMCQTKAVHEDLLSLCERIATSQQEQIEMLTRWLSAWYHEEHQPNAEHEPIQDLEALTGKAFEVAFMVQMIEHHRQAIDEASECLVRAYHPELLGLCRDIVVEQAKEIAQMRRWLCKWYRLCVLRKHLPNVMPKGPHVGDSMPSPITR